MDTDGPEEAIQTADVALANRVPVVAANIPVLPDTSQGLTPLGPKASSPTELLASILRFKWTLTAVFVLVSAPLLAAVWTQVVPKYQARAEIRVRPIIPRLVFKTDENGTIPFYESFVNTQVSLIRSPAILQRVLDQDQIRTTQWYRSSSTSLKERLKGGVTPPMEKLRQNLSVRSRPRTEIVDVSFTDTSASDARIIVDTVLEEYTKYVAEMSDADRRELDGRLREQYNLLETEIKGREKIIAGLHKSLQTELPQELISNRRLRLDEAQGRLSALQNRITILRWEMKQETVQDGNNVAVATGSMDELRRYHTDAEWRRLDLDVRRIRHEIDTSRYTPSHPERIRLAKDLEFAEELLDLRKAQLDEQSRDRLRGLAGATTTVDTAVGDEEGTSVQYQLARAEREEQLLQADLESQMADFTDLFQTAQLLEEENNVLRHKRDLFEAVRQRLEQKQMESNVPGSITVVTSAFSPSQPQQDRRVVFTAMVLFLGLSAGGGAAFLRASRDQAIYTPNDMPPSMQAPFLGHVPLIRTRKLLGGVLGDPPGEYQLPLIESVRVMRTALLSRLNGQDCASVLITSATSGTGKSSFTIILGKSLAHVGKNVLLIDADFHKMTLSKRFDLLDSPGLIDALDCRCVDKRHIFPTETPGLSIMPIGKRRNNGVVFEEIANGAFRGCMDQLAERHDYDIILLDGSPILPVADAIILASQVDGTIMVEREHVSQRAEVADALIRLGLTGGRLLGTVFVGSAGERAYQHEYSYRHGKAAESYPDERV